MDLIGFLKRISAERFIFLIKYFEATSSIEVQVDAGFEKWIVSFDAGGKFDGFIRYQEVESSDDEDALAGLFDRPHKAWENAAKDLQITFLGPYRFSIEENWHSVTGLLPDFGYRTGTLVTTRKDADVDTEMASATEYNVSHLNSYHYDQYDRDRFMNALNDLGWCGKGKPPSWFKGKITSG